MIKPGIYTFIATGGIVTMAGAKALPKFPGVSRGQDINTIHRKVGAEIARYQE